MQDDFYKDGVKYVFLHCNNTSNRTTYIDSSNYYLDDILFISIISLSTDIYISILYGLKINK